LPIENEDERKTFQEDFGNFLKTTESRSTEFTGKHRTYEDRIKSGFNLTKVVRIENTNYTDSFFGKTGDFTLEAISKLIEQGESDASKVFE
jgi:NTE family protein